MHVPLTEITLRHEGAELVRATLPPGEYVIGREVGVEVRADTPLLSRRHARLTINYDHLLLEDLGSSNGTFVNDRPIAEATRLFPNQSIRLGPDITLEVRRHRAPTEPGVSLAPAQAAIARHLPEELLAEKRYAIGGIIAQGGMGAILDARQNATQRTVAMKVMLETSEEADVLRFIEEAQVTAQLDHPNIVPIYELGVDEQGQVFYTMKMVRGITLKKVLELLAAGVPETVKRYPLPALLTVFQKVCDALAFAHAKGVIHRDLKPENIMLGDFGSVLVMDWGLAKVLGNKETPGVSVTRSAVFTARAAEPEVSATMAGAIMGTPAYMSPEQARGEIETLDARSDIYALGAILFEILALRPSVTGTDAMEIVGKVARGEVEPLECGGKRQRDAAFAGAERPAKAPSPLRSASALQKIPDSLAAVVRQAMAFDKTARYPRVEDLQADLLAYQNGFATSAENAGAWRQIALLVRRHKAVSIATAILFVVISAALANVIVSERRQRATLARLRGTAPTFVAQAGALIDDGKFDDALGKLAFATDLAPGLARAHLLRGHILQTQLHFPEALASLQTALSLARDPAEVADARANLALCEKIQSDNRGQPEVLPKSLAELTEAISHQGRTAEALALAPGAGLAGKFRYEAMFTKLKALLKIPNSQDEDLRKRLSLDDSGFFSLALHGWIISDLSPLRGLPIRSLNLSNCRNVSDIAPLKGLPLESLNIEGTKVSDISPLRGMKLRWLSAYQTGISDLSPLAGMPLAHLDLHYNAPGVSNLTPLAGMPLKLLSLTLSDEVSDIRPLKGMPLEALFFFGRSKVADISVLLGMPLRDLNLVETSVRDVAVLAEIPTIELLTIRADSINVDALRHLPNLKRIGYPGLNRITPTEFWAEYDHLVQVRAAVPEGEVSVIEVRGLKLDAIRGLRLDLHGKDISDLRPLRSLPIDFLSLPKTKVTDLAPLRGMRLKMLSFEETAVADVSPLLDLPILEAAMVTQRATNLEVLRQHPTLKYLGWENDWDADANRPKLTTTEFWARYDAQRKAGAK